MQQIDIECSLGSLWTCYKSTPMHSDYKCIAETFPQIAEDSRTRLSNKELVDGVYSKYARHRASADCRMTLGNFASADLMDTLDASLAFAAICLMSIEFTSQLLSKN